MTPSTPILCYLLATALIIDTLYITEHCPLLLCQAFSHHPQHRSKSSTSVPLFPQSSPSSSSASSSSIQSHPSITTLHSSTVLSTTSSTNRRPIRLTLLATLYDDFDDFFQDDNNGGKGSSSTDSSSTNRNGGDFAFSPSDSDMYAALRARQESLIRQKQQGAASLSSSTSCRNSAAGDGRRINNNDDDHDLAVKEQCRCNWIDANCISTVRLSLDNDWVRRIAIDLYPLAVVGSSGGDLYLADLEHGDELDCLEHVHLQHYYDTSNTINLDDDIETDRNLLGMSGRPPQHLDDGLSALYGKYDGGGVIAIAVKGDLVVSSGREGGVHVCTIEGTEEQVYSGSRGGKSRRTQLQLQPQGKLRGLEGRIDGTDEYERDNLMSERFRSSQQTHRRSTAASSAPLITSLAFDNQGTLWVAGYDGILRGYDYEQTDMDDKPLMLRQKHADHEVDVGSPLLSVSVHDVIGCGVITTETDGVFVFSLEDGQILDRWNPFEGSPLNSHEFARTALLVQTDERGVRRAASDVDDKNLAGSFLSPNPDDAQWSVVVGGSKGNMYQRRLAIHPQTGLIANDYDNGNGSFGIFLDQHSVYHGSDEDDVLGPIKIRPNHLGPVVALASPGPGLLVSGSHDGTMRVWDCSLYGFNDVSSSTTDEEDDEADEFDEDEDEDDDDEEDDDDDQNTLTFFLDDENNRESEDGTARPKRPKVLYALSGYKVWLGSIIASSKKLVSDGADNSIIVHSFDEDEETVLRSQDDDDDDLEEDLDVFFD